MVRLQQISQAIKLIKQEIKKKNGPMPAKTETPSKKKLQTSNVLGSGKA